MANAGTIKDVRPKYAIPGGEFAVEGEGFRLDPDGDHGCYVNERQCRITAASSKRILAIVPSDIREYEQAKVTLGIGGEYTNNGEIHIAGTLADEMHIVANPAIDPKDEAIIVTRSGSRGQQLANTIYRIEPDGFIDELPDPILNPTGIAFGPDGKMYITNRAEGEVHVVNVDGNNTVHATGLGIATGIAFDGEGVMYVGDRSGTIYDIKGDEHAEVFAKLEPSVAAYHMAFGPDGRLYVTAPGLASHDAVYAIDADGEVSAYFRGLGRPQGLAFDSKGNLFVAACYQGKHGIVRIAAGGASAELFVTGNNIVGLCFTRSGDMIVATNDTVYSLPVGIHGTLISR